jgi:hypothetical protein
MKHFINGRIFALVFTLLLGVLPAAAVEHSFALNGSGAPSRIAIWGDGVLIEEGFNATGTATYLGLWSTSGTLRFDRIPDDPTHLLETGDAILISANGDKLDVVFEDALFEVATETSTGHLRLVGGTGRFAGASGTANFVATQSIANGTFQLTAVGSIDL